MSSVSATSERNEDPVSNIAKSLDKLEVKGGNQQNEVGSLFLFSQQL